jgi:hypothetical protein
MRYPTGKYPIEKINNNLYQVLEEWPIEKIKDPQGVREWLRCDSAFKHNQRGVYLFCNKIEEAQIIE